MNWKHIIILVGVVLIGFGCTERIDIDLDETYSRLVVDGEITDEAKAHKVKLSMTGSFLGGEPDIAVSGATITIENSRETITLSEVEGMPGTYLTDPDVAGIPGETYTLRINLKEEINGIMEYTASSELFAAGPLDSVAVRWIDRWEVFEVMCYALDPPTEDFYMFDIYRNNIHLTDTISEKFVVDDRLYNGQYTNGIGVGYLDPENPDEDLQPGDTITLRLARITKEHTYYIWEVQEETGYQNPLFGGPPANVVGNISDGAIGYFAAYAVQYASTEYDE
jgi:hypothetical protein